MNYIKKCDVVDCVSQEDGWCTAPCSFEASASAAQERIGAAIDELKYSLSAQDGESIECHIQKAIALLQAGRK